MEQFLSEALITGHGVTLSEALSVGGMVTGVGLSIVFSVLVILMLVLMLFKVIFYKDESKKKRTEVTGTAQTAVNNTPAASTAVQTADDSELIAVLTAAVAAALNTSTYNLCIKSYRRTDTNSNAWNKAGIRENTFNKTY